MRNHYLHTDFLLHDDGNLLSIGSTRKGKVIFTPQQNLYVISLGFQFVKTEIGNYITKEKVVQEVIFIRNKRLKKGQSYQFNFSIKGINPPTYNGKNTQVKWFLKNAVKLDSKSYLRVRNHYLQKNKLTHFNDTPDLLTEKMEVQVSNAHLPYHISEQKIHLEKSGLYNVLMFLICAVIGIQILSKLNLENVFLIWLGLATLLALIFLVPHFYTSYILNKLNFEVQTLQENQFSVNLSLKKNQTQVRKVKVNYSVHEEFQERYKNKYSEEEIVYPKKKAELFESPIIEKYRLPKNTAKVLDFPEVNYDFVFDFPEEEISPTRYKSDLKVNWFLHITIYFIFGFKSNFKKKIEVKRKDLPQRK